MRPEPHRTEPNRHESRGIKTRAFAASGDCSLLVHGGAWAIPDDELDGYRAGLREAVLAGRSALIAGVAAMDVVAIVVATMEASGAFDAGSGSVLTADGSVELDAGIMDGATLAWGSVGAVRRIPNPVKVAHTLAHAGEGQVRMMVADGAESFAERHGHPLVSNSDLVCERERRRLVDLQSREGYHTSHTFLVDHPAGTVGCVARDRHGGVAAATSTGGTPNRPAGRVGDTPLPGCGFYATAKAAASATGWGEGIATVLLCGRAVLDAERALATTKAATEDSRIVEGIVQERLASLGSNVLNTDGDGATAGLILLDAYGNGAIGYSTPRMARAGWSGDGEAWWIVD